MTDSPVLQRLKIPLGLPVARYKAPAHIELPENQELPLIDKKTPADKRVQEVWNARVRVFDLSNDEQRKEYEKVWQNVCNGRAVVSEHKTEFHNGSYIALLRWADLEYKLPTQV